MLPIFAVSIRHQRHLPEFHLVLQRYCLPIPSIALSCPRTVTSDRSVRDSLVEEAGYALWLFIVQREACGLNDSAHVMQDYGVPHEVYARMGSSAMPSIHPTKTVGG